MIKSKLTTSFFQKYLDDTDIRIFRKSLIYYLLFRTIKNFLSSDIILNIYDFKVYGSINKNKTSYFLLKKCEFGDYHELNVIKKFSNKNKILFFDCGCNYGFYSLYVASLSKENKIISIEASKNTFNEFEKNILLNNFLNIKKFNKAVSYIDDQVITFNESEKDWESSISHNNFSIYRPYKVNSVKIDTLAKDHKLENYKTIIKLDIEGNEMNAIRGSLDLIHKSSPLIIIEFSKYIFDKYDNIEYFKNFLIDCDYSIYDTNYKIKKLEDILNELNNLKKKHKTIGNFYLIKNYSKTLKDFLSCE